MKDDSLTEVNDLVATEMQSDTVPDPERQREVISNIDSECTCTYAVSKAWYKHWEEYTSPSESPRHKTEPPGPIDMDTHNDANNDYVHEDSWKLLVRWYGVSANHQLDRRHLYFKDEKMFDVCMLSPFSGIVEHTVKKFNRFEEIGYIECQLRKIFHVPLYKKSRLWISEKAQVPRFRQLLLRFRMLNDCIHRDKVYILALEECIGNDHWPTGEPGEAKGDMGKYLEIVSGRKADNYFNKEITSAIENLHVTVSENVKQMAESFVQNANALISDKEADLDGKRKALDGKLDDTDAKEKFLDDKSKEVVKQEHSLRADREQLEEEKQDFEETIAKFEEEVKQMEEIHKIQETKIKLDIGGHCYSTSIHTLRRDPDSMLAHMFSGRHELKKESDGSYFIDRDGIHFRYILNFLRDGYVDSGTLPSDPVLHKELLREAKYYQLAGLVSYLEDVLENNKG